MARFAPHERRTASDDIAQAIRRYIQALEPGDRIGTEQSLAEEFGVSRPTIREALRQLSSVHLIQSTRGPGGGIFVARTANESMGRSLSESIDTMLTTDAVSLAELLRARIVLEVPLAGLAAQYADDEAIAALEEILAETKACLGDHDAFVKWDAAFHRTLATAAGNELLLAIVSWAYDVLQPKMVSTLRDEVSETEILAQHRAILRAVKARKPAKAEAAMRAHLEYLFDVLRKHSSYNLTDPPDRG
jgi:DNA-binding FadR family transcriptional regulator